MRKDLLTNTMQPKKELVRVVIDKEKNISVDPTGKKPGRGAYVSLDPSKIESAKESEVLERSWVLKCQIVSMKNFILMLITKKQEKNCLVINNIAK